MIVGFVKGQSFTQKQPVVVSNSINYLEAKFVFQTSDWAELIKFAHFKNGESVYDFILNGDVIPKEAKLNLYAGEWEVYIHGDRYIVDEKGEEKIVERITTNSQVVRVVKYEQDGEVLPEIGLSVAEQIAAIADNAKKIATSVRNEADAGAFDGKDGYTPVKGIDYFDGNDGVSVTHEWEGTVLKVTSASGTTSADLKGETGPKGEKGDTGPRGESGVIDVSGAAPGQIIKVKSVDKNGNPIEWEAVDFPEAEQFDWNAAEGEPGHVLNRTHWATVEAVEPLAETTVAFSDGVGPIVDAVDIAVGSTYTATWNGTEYECVAFAFEMNGINYASLGNSAAGGGEDSGEPFMFLAVPSDMVDAMGVGAMVMALDGSTTATVAIRGEAEVVHPLDEKYIPDTVGVPVVQLASYGILDELDMDGDVLSAYLDEEKLRDLRNKLRKGFAFVYGITSGVDIDHIDADNTDNLLQSVAFSVQIIRNNENYYGVCNIPNGKQFRLELSSARKLSVALKTVTS